MYRVYKTFFRAKRKRVRVPMAHNQKRRGQNTTPASHQKTRNPTPTPRKRGRARPLGTPHGRGDCNNRRTNARTSSEPRNHRRESPQKVGEKTCTVHMKAKRPKRHFWTLVYIECIIRFLTLCKGWRAPLTAKPLTAKISTFSAPANLSSNCEL